MKHFFSFSFFLALVNFCSAQKADFTYSISGRGNSITPWTDIRKVDLETGESEIFYKEDSIEYELNSLDRNIPEVALDAMTPMGLGVASCAYDAKRNRLFYSSMEYSDLRFYNLNKENPAFTIVKIDLVPSPNFTKTETQFSRMTIASDGYGYAISNDAKHVVRFSTDKKPQAEDLGSLECALPPIDSMDNIFLNQGGDIVADNNQHLILITARQTVFVIDIETRKARYVGRIKNLPVSFTINGACVYSNDELIVSSALTLNGLYKVSLQDLTSQALPSTAPPFTSSDLDNGILLSDETTSKLIKNHDAAKSIKPASPAIVEEEASVLGFYFSQTHKNEIQLTFSKDELGEFKITISDAKGKLILEKNAVISEASQIANLNLQNNLLRGGYYIKALHIKTGHVYLKKLEVQ